jgi:hypothetical protein
MPTLTVSEILSSTLDSFKTRVPALGMMSTDFTSTRMKKGQSGYAHIRTLPSVADYDAAEGGYFNGASEARSLLTDVPIVADGHKHVTISLTHLNAIADKKDALAGAIGDAAYVLAKSVVDSALAKFTAANVSQSTTETIANTDRDTLGTVRKALNSKKAPARRFGIVNSDFAEALMADTRIASGDFYGQRLGQDPYVVLENLGGFEKIVEYPDLPTAGNLTGAFFAPESIVIWTGLPDDSSELAAQYGIPQVVTTEVVTDPNSGLSLLGILGQKQGTLDLTLTVTMLYGTAVGKQGGSAGAITDYAGHRVISA